ncbi:thiamine pyrophosphate enzyme, C-terminal TPP binding domain protein [Clostridioides difficile CD160]|nr:thiamine pyrophosphate enzyme, C-terminal TPP binding domain protein [Clostridioides difficile CD160]
MAKKAPAIMMCENMFCGGCGHSIVDRIIGEVLTEMDICQDTIICSDIGCNHMFQFSMNVDVVVPPHGKMGAAMAAMKRVRPDKYIFTIAGDGGAYAIGLGETMSAATRNDNVIFLVMNNNMFAMTGGQMAPTTIEGQYTASTPNGRNYADHGSTFDVVKVMGNLDIAYLARGTITNPKEINTTKRYIKKALEKQKEKKGFCLIEVLVPCPTNWGLKPVDAMKRIENELVPKYPLGEFID